MKILIADDVPTRYGALEDAFRGLEIGIEVDYVTCARQARDSLSATKYELLILDVLLPDRASQTGDSADFSMDLLNELSDDCDLIKPKYILGITGDLDALDTNSRYFTDNTWTIIKYDPMEDGWSDKIINCVKYIFSQEQGYDSKSVQYDFDLVILCALENPELSEFLKLDWHWLPPKPVDNLMFIHEGHFSCKNKTYKVAAVCADRMGMVESALCSSKLIEYLKPRCIAMAGICAGVQGKVDLGDILFADPVWDYQAGKLCVDDNGKNYFQIEPHQISADPDIRSLARQAMTAEIVKEIYVGFPTKPPTGLPSFKVGPVATGSAVLADGEKVNELLMQNRKLLGIEMEIYGMYAASQKASLRPKIFAIKSVCDFASPEKTDDIQRFSSYLSANSIKIIMEEYGDRIL